MSTITESDLGIVQDLLAERADEIERLNSELVNKDNLVQAITSRLEETVEQLDRLQRQGPQRGGQAGGGGSSREVLESQQALSERVEQSLTCWESTATYFDQILQRLDEIAAQGPGSGGAAPAQDPGMSAYDRMKANLLAHAPPPVPSAPASAASSSPADPAPELGAPPPSPINTDSATHEELVEAVLTRDAFIGYLIQQFRTRDDSLLRNFDWTLIKSAPEDIRPELTTLTQRLREKIQREELDLSMERARIAREQARIELVKQQLEAQIRRLTPGAAPVEPPKEEKGGKDGWLKRLKKQ
jgi:hypothetical protein